MPTKQNLYFQEFLGPAEIGLNRTLTVEFKITQQSLLISKTYYAFISRDTFFLSLMGESDCQIIWNLSEDF